VSGRGRWACTIAVAVLAISVLAPGGSASGSAPAQPSAPDLSPRVMAAAMRLPGTAVRREPGAQVRRVDVPARLVTPGVPDIYRVRVAGRYPPRALRYQILSDGLPVGYGIPTLDGGAVQTVTTDTSVLTGRLSVRYGLGAPRPPASGSSPPLRAPSVRLPHLADPAARGSLAVTRKRYDLGEQVFKIAGLPGKVELAGDVTYPSELSGGPYPLVLFLHGNHYSCYRGRRAGYEWPCRKGWKPLPNYLGYDYIASRLASHGFVVVSVSGNGVNVLGNYVDDTGMRQRGELLEKHLDLWHAWSTVGGGPFGSRFVGKIDFSRVGVMGHSRGGEGAVYNVIVDRERPSPYGIDAVLPLAPVDFTRVTVNDIPMAVMLPYCDGDVSDLEGMHFFDDARYRQPGDPTPKATVVVMGADHNFFNSVWSPSGGYPGAFDDGSPRCPGRLTQSQQRRVGRTYVVGFFRRYVGGTTSLDPMWTGEATPAAIAPAQARVSYLAPDTAATRLDLDRFTDPGALSRDAVGGSVRATGMSSYGWCANTYEIPCVPGQYAFTDVHLPGLAEGVLGWSDDHASVRYGLPSATGDVSGYDALQFRVAVNPSYDANYGVRAQDLTVVLSDGSGHRAEVTAAAVGNAALAYPQGLRRYLGHVILNQIRFPLSAFAGVDLTDVRSVTLRFDRTSQGVIDLADLAFSRGG
jgi:hypothetical protein